MDAELKAKWVAALRSGEFKQARGRLRDDLMGGYCCLGVLCKIANLAIDADGMGTGGQGPTFEGYRPIHALIDRKPYEGADKACELANLNDGSPLRKLKPHSFAEIADYIEKNL